MSDTHLVLSGFPSIILLSLSFFTEITSATNFTVANKLSLKTGWDVDYAMRYEDPSIENALLNFKNKGIYKIIVISLYPHNALATTITT